MVVVKKWLILGIFLLLLYLVLLYKAYYLIDSRLNVWLEIYTILTGLFLLS